MACPRSPNPSLASGLVAALVVASMSWLVPAGARSSPEVHYVEPVDGVVVDAFRPPERPYGPGNRGWEYATRPGSPAVAAADGVVLFAGPAAGFGVVTILHADGLRTSLTFLTSVATRRGAVVRRGEPVGTVGARVHLGVRAPDGTYLDPASIIGRMVARARLAPGGDDGTAVHDRPRRIDGGATPAPIGARVAVGLVQAGLRSALALSTPGP